MEAVLIDLKAGKLTHQDLGQLQLSVNDDDREKRTPGLILCTDKNDTVVKYTLGADQKKQIFASRHQLHLPTEAELRAALGQTRPAVAGKHERGNAWLGWRFVKSRHVYLIGGHSADA